MPGKSAATSRFRMPAEWSPHQATWFSWPHNVDTWTDYLPAVERVLADAVAALTTGELVRINVRDSGHAYHVQKLLEGKAPRDKVILHQFPTNDSWCRDHGAIFVTREPGEGPTLKALDFQYNAWGGKYPPFDLDNAIPGRMAETLDVPVEEHRANKAPAGSAAQAEPVTGRSRPTVTPRQPSPAVGSRALNRPRLTTFSHRTSTAAQRGPTGLAPATPLTP